MTTVGPGGGGSSAGGAGGSGDAITVSLTVDPATMNPGDTINGTVVVERGEKPSMCVADDTLATTSAVAEVPPANGVPASARKRTVAVCPLGRFAPVIPNPVATSDGMTWGVSVATVGGGATNKAMSVAEVPEIPSDRVTVTNATVMTDGAPTARVELRVIDQGPGIPAEDLPHVFERFYRSDPARTGSGAGASGGAGIGLTIAREVLAPGGGAISVERTGPEGTTVLISLPAVG